MSRALVGDVAYPVRIDALQATPLIVDGAGKTKPALDETQIVQGHLENSGTNPTLEMLELIETSRMFESNINMIKMQDDTLDRLISSLPRR